MANPAVAIRYGMRIRLRHESTQRFLKSLGKNYSHSDSSLQQMVVTAIEADDSTTWLVKPMSDHPSLNRTNEVVKNKDLLRLEHVATRRNLHSHGHPAPINRDQQEVSAFGIAGEGDANDEWTLEAQSEVWLAGAPVRLVHRATRKNLHSHSSTHPVFSDGFQEVTCYSGRDANDLWSAIPVQPSEDGQTPIDDKQKLPNSFGSRLERGEVLVSELINESELGKSMDEADRIAFLTGAALAIERASGALDSCDILSGYLLTADPGQGQSERALVRIAWDEYVARHPDAHRENVINVWRIVLPSEAQKKETLQRIQEERTARIKVSAGLGVMLHRSVAVATEAGRSQPFSTRHLIACLLGPREWGTDPEGTARIANLPLNLKVVRRSFSDWMRQWRKEDNATVIDQVLGVIESPSNTEVSGGSSKSRSAFVSGPPGYSSEYCGVGGIGRVPDDLQVEAFAHRLADLIALRETKLPLAIGLFGDWGSGKSHFMNLIDRRLKAVAAIGGPQLSDSSDPWCREIVPIYFNAWHYHDTNLWASLIAEIFDSLYGHLQKKPDALAAMEARLEKAGGVTARAAEAAAEARNTADNAAKAYKKAQADVDGARSLLVGLFDNLRSLLPRLNTPDNQRQLVELLGVEPELATLSKLREKHRDLTTWPGLGRDLVKRIMAAKGRGWRIGWLVGAVIIGPTIVFYVSEHWTWIQRWFGVIGPQLKILLGALIGLAGWLTPLIAKIRGTLAQIELLQSQAEQAYAERDKDVMVVAAERQLVQAEAAAASAAAEFTTACATEEKLAAKIDDLRPARRLNRYVEDRARSADYRGQLGLISLARRDFQELSEIFADAEALEAKVKDMKPEEATRIRSLGTMVDRIVLFVDDLDRCQPEKIVDVLQAVHLLLASPLFAVVVGVDQRCLRRSLQTQFRGLLTTPPSEKKSKQSSDEYERLATPLDYLEKIFHVPFHLPGMDERGFATLIERLTNTSRSTAKPRIDDENRDSVSQPPFASEPPAAAVKSLDTGGTPAKAVVTLHSPETLQTPTSVVVGSVPLYDWECTALKDYHSMIRTPRGATRLINTYRLVRAGIPAEEWEAFRGDETLHGEFRVAMLLLTAAAGYPALARKWFALLRDADPSVLLISDDITVGPDTKAWLSFKNLFDATIVKTSPNLTRDLISKWLDRIERFAF
jgi:hypothetical protein